MVVTINILKFSAHESKINFESHLKQTIYWLKSVVVPNRRSTSLLISTANVYYRVSQTFLFMKLLALSF